MQCERCKKQKATVFLTQIIGGKMHKVDLCESCAKEMGVTDATGFSLADLLLNMGKEQDGSEEEQEVSLKPEQMACPSCGMTQEDIKKTGRLGCPDCYEYFHETISAILEEVQKSLQHKGKVPASAARGSIESKGAGKQETAELIKELQNELLQAINDEEFEKAAKLRDRIKRLREETNE